MVFSPLRWPVNHMLRSSMVYEIRDEMRHEIWELEESMISRMDTMISLMDKLLKTVEKLNLLVSMVLNTDILTSEELGQLLIKLTAAPQSAPPPPSPRPVDLFGPQRGRIW